MEKKQSRFIELILLFIVILLLVLILVDLVQDKVKERATIPFETLLSVSLGVKEDEINRSYMIDGNTGASVETTSPEKIKELLNILYGKYYTKAKNQEGRTGYTYTYRFYSDDKELIRIVGSGSNVSINGTYYDVSEEISYEKLKKWYDELLQYGV